MRRRASTALLCSLALAAPGAAGQDGTSSRAQDTPAQSAPAREPVPPPTLGRAEARAGMERALAFLVGTQQPEGGWGSSLPHHLAELGFAHDTYHAWRVAAHALATQALLVTTRSQPDPGREEALRRAVEWLVTIRLPHRGADWDVDSTWASLLGFDALVDVARDPRFARGPLAEPVRARAQLFLADLARRQTPDGGWAYYDDPPFTSRPTWATSFCTALVLPALVTARDELGWEVAPHLIEGARRLVRRCELPNGAFAYDFRAIQRGHTGESINSIEGSLGRIQVCLWALERAGDRRITRERVVQGLERFFEHRRFLDLVRLRPIPHEGWFANAGYFYFFAHYYASRAIALLPEGEREAWHRLLRPHLVKTLSRDGSSSDFLTSNYMVLASTSYLILALHAGLEGDGGS